MASLGSQDLHVNITWDTEPTEKAKAFVKQAVIEALSEIVTDTAWLHEIVQAEVHKAFQAEAKAINERIGSVRRD